MIAKIKKFLSKHKYKIIIAGIGMLAVGYILYDYTSKPEIKLSHFKKALQLKHIEEVVVKDKIIEFRSGDSEWYRTYLGSYPTDKLEQLFGLMKKQNVTITNKEPISTEAINIGAAVLFSAVSLKVMINEIQKPEISSTNMESTIVKNNQTFQDFYGGENIKVKFKEIIDFLKQPERYQKMGARIRRGVLFHGPPGTGKTMIARALANEAGCQFIKVVASEFQEMFVGVGAKRVRQLFNNARSCPHGCIIFIDEIDALGSRLNHLRDSHETTSTINQFLSEMDGFSPTDRIVIVAATNRIDLVDYAILRAGRFDIKIRIDLPNRQERKGIFNKLVTTKCKSYELSSELISEVADRSQAWCGADLENLINESIYKAIKQKSDTLRGNHVLEAMADLQGK